MNCPHCDENPVEPGPNCRVKVELPDETIEKLVCEECANLFADHITA